MLPDDFLTPPVATVLIALGSPSARLTKVPKGKTWRIVNLDSGRGPASVVPGTIAEILIGAALIDPVTGQLLPAGRDALPQARALLDGPAPGPDQHDDDTGADAVMDPPPPKATTVTAALAAARPASAYAEDGGSSAPAPPLVDEPDADECPVIPLGKAGEKLWVLTRMGELMEITPKVTANAFVNIFDGDARWLIQRFRRFDKDGRATQDFVVREAYGWFVRQCVKRGIFDPTIGQRGIGVWRGPLTDGGVTVPVVHIGGEILVIQGRKPRDGEPPTRGGGEEKPWRRERAGWHHDHALYVVRPGIDAPDLDNPATAADGAALVAVLDLWSWEQPFEAMLFAGWLGAALYGGYPAWRVHALLAAEFGSGKSTLLDLAKAVLGAMQREFNDITEAGARAALANEARCLVVDEAEGGPDGKIARLIELLRRMAGGDGASVARGSPGQTLNESRVTGCALMAGINPPALDPADRSRIIRLELKKVTAGDPEKVGRIKERTAWAGTMSARFRARALLHYQLFNDCLRLFRAGLIAAGCDGRQADLLSVLLSGREILLFDSPPTADDIAERIEVLRGHIGMVREVDAESGDAHRCLNHLLSYETPDRRGGETNTIGNLIAMARAERDDGGQNRRALLRYGLRLATVTPQMQAKYPMTTGHMTAGAQYLLVANDHGALSRIFSGSAAGKWGRGNWTASLRRLDSDTIRPWPKPERFAGPLCRALAIPVFGEWLPEPDDGVADPSVPPGGDRDVDAIL